jgi:RNA polymerase sigma-70 factor (ECF subfamily)
MATETSSQEMLERARLGDRLALQQLLWEHYDRLSAFIATRLTGDLRRLVGADDVLQETFVLAIRDIGKCEADCVQTFAGWLFTIAEHRLNDIIKELYRKKRGGAMRRLEATGRESARGWMQLVDLISDDHSTPGRKLARGEAVQALQIGIAALPEDQRQAIRLRYLEGRSIEHSAEMMGRTTAAINGLVRRAKQSLRATLLESSRWLSPK